MDRTRKLISLLLAVCLLIGLVPAAFAESVSSGTSYAGKTVKLMTNISGITVSVGTQDHPFDGVFDGNGHIIIVDISDTENQGTAPFRCMEGGTIKNLTVTGSVTGTTHTAGLLGFSKGSGNLIENCMVSTDVLNPADSGLRHIGGIVGHALTSSITIRNCVFSGTMSNSGDYAGGLIGWCDPGASMTFDNCLFAGHYAGSKIDGFHPVAVCNYLFDITYSVANGLFTTEDRQGLTWTQAVAYHLCREAHLLAPEYGLYQIYTFPGSYNCYAPDSISGIYSCYPYTGQPVNVSPVVKDEWGDPLQEGRDYTVTFYPNVPQEMGDYTMVISGTGDHGGEASYSFTVSDRIPVDPVQNAWLDGITYYVDEDVTISGRVSVSGNVKLILKEGKTLTVKNGISVPEGSTLTVDTEDHGGTSGTLRSGVLEQHTVNWNPVLNCETWLAEGTRLDSNGNQVNGLGPGVNRVETRTFTDFVISDGCSGIGASSGQTGGTIVIDGGTVTVLGGNNAPGIGGGGSTVTINGGAVTARSLGGATGIGGEGDSVTLGWSSPDDFIDSSGYAGTVSFAAGKAFSYSSDLSLVTLENLTSGRIIPRAEEHQITLSVVGEQILTINLSSAIETQLIELTQTDGLEHWTQISITASDGSSIPFTRTDVNTYRFSMPDMDVTVSADISPITKIEHDGHEYLPLSKQLGLRTLSSGYYVADADIILPYRLEIQGDVELFLAEGATLTCSSGIHVSKENSLTIYGKGTLTADATACWNCAGIGGDDRQACGTVRILSGIVNASSNTAAGIGAGGLSSGGTVIITGGQVTASGGHHEWYGTSHIEFWSGLGDNSQEGTGSITIGWTDVNDFININGYHGSLTIQDGKQFVRVDNGELVTAQNLGGAKIIPYVGGIHNVALTQEGNTVASLSSSRAANGQTVIVSWDTQNGRTGVDLVTATDADGNDIPVTVNGNSSRSFIMPDCDVSVHVRFTANVITKTGSNTYLGTRWLEDPMVIEQPVVTWENGYLKTTYHYYSRWNYVYFGKYNGNALRYRVLDKASQDFGVSGGSLLLDCDQVIETMPFQEDITLAGNIANRWEYSTARSWLNGDSFLNDPACFTAAENAAIAPSTKAAKAATDGPGWDYLDFQPLNGEKIFLLDNTEAHSAKYAYVSDIGTYINYHGASRLKSNLRGDRQYAWWVRSHYSDNIPLELSVFIMGDGLDSSDDYDREYRGCINPTLPFAIEADGSPLGVSPALNIRLSDILFITDVSTEHELAYKLTLKDSSMSVSVTPGQSITNVNGTVTVPYTVTGDPDRLVLMLASRDYSDSTAMLCGYYPLASGQISSSGTVEFEATQQMLSGNYRIYLVAEKANPWNCTDYAAVSDPITVPEASGNDPAGGEKPVFRSQTLVLSGRIGVNFYVDLSMLTDAEKQAAVMEFTVDGKTWTAAFDPNFTNPGGDGYYGFTCYINSSQMADEISAVLKYRSGEEVSQTYSAAQYIDYIDTHSENYSDTAVALVKATADYGHYMTPFIKAHGSGASTGTEINSYTDYTEAQISEAKDAVAAKAIAKSDPDGILTAVTYKLILGSETTVNLFFKAADGRTISGTESIRVAKASSPDVPVGNAAVSFDGNRFSVRITDINAAQLADRYLVTVTDSSSAAAIIEVCALSYANSVMTNDTYKNDATSVNAMTSLYYYYKSAVEYVGN